MSEEKLVYLEEAQLHQLIKDKLMAAGLEEVQAQETANHLTYADMIGIHSHGAVRVEYYSERINKGGITNQPNLRYDQTGPSTLTLYADNAQGHYAGQLGVEKAIEMAKETGVAVVGVAHCGHAGTLSYFLRQIVEHDLLGISATQSDPMVVPFGGAEPFYGTNPLGFGAPGEDGDHFIFDMATTVQAWGKVLDARSKGLSIPDTWAVNKKGLPTTDPNDIGGLVSIAGPKGYGLMMAVDIFSGILFGLPAGKNVSSMYHDLTKGRDLGILFIVIDPDKFIGRDNFKAALKASFEELRSVKPAEGSSGVRVPGESSVRRYAKHKEEGVGIPESIVNYLKSDDIHYDNYDGLGIFAD